MAHHRWRGQEPRGALSIPESRKGAFQKQRTLSSEVYTSLYKRIKSSINMQLYTEPIPRTGKRGRGLKAREPSSHLVPDVGGGKGCLGPQSWSPAQRTGGPDFREHWAKDPASAGGGRWGKRQVSDSGDCQGVLQPGPLLSPLPLPSSLAKCKLGPWGRGRGRCPAGHSGPCAHNGSSWSRGRHAPGGMLSAVPWSMAPLGASLCSDLPAVERRGETVLPWLTVFGGDLATLS